MLFLSKIQHPNTGGEAVRVRSQFWGGALRVRLQRGVAGAEVRHCLRTPLLRGRREVFPQALQLPRVPVPSEYLGWSNSAMFSQLRAQLVIKVLCTFYRGEFAACCLSRHLPPAVPKTTGNRWYKCSFMAHQGTNVLYHPGIPTAYSGLVRAKINVFLLNSAINEL